eukprot:GILK01011350.1.p1 GENE.GILK01011350.1~~GILK01011350.1.p1  ORF type:complete len:123 (+),score=13.60 GILK01011350.1:84-452(+)
MASFLFLIPTVFYSDIEVGKKTWIECLQFSVLYDDGEGFFVLQKDRTKLHMKLDPEFAIKDRPEIRIETDDIHRLCLEVTSRCPDLLHPNVSKVTARPWGMNEFAIRDKEDTCIIFQQRIDS